MSQKEAIIKQINDFDKSYFNQDQKNIMIDIINNAPEWKAQTYFNFMKYKRKTGFAFDYSPEIYQDRIITLQNDSVRGINVGDVVMSGEVSGGGVKAS